MRSIKLKAILCAACIALPGTGEARILTCVYTEPFMKVEFNTVTRTLKQFMGSEAKPRRVFKVGVRTYTKEKLEVFSRKSKFGQSLTLDGNGSDGASDKRYPYSAIWLESGQKLYGGCDAR